MNSWPEYLASLVRNALVRKITRSPTTISGRLARGGNVDLRYADFGVLTDKPCIAKKRIHSNHLIVRKVRESLMDEISSMDQRQESTS